MSLDEEVEFTFGWWLNKNYGLRVSNFWYSSIASDFLPDRDFLLNSDIAIFSRIAIFFRASESFRKYTYYDGNWFQFPTLETGFCFQHEFIDVNSYMWIHTCEFIHVNSYIPTLPTNTTTMAIALGNSPLPPHMKSNFRRICIGMIGDNAPSKRIWFSPAMSWSKAFKMLQWCGNDGDESRLAIGAFWGL